MGSPVVLARPGRETGVRRFLARTIARTATGEFAMTGPEVAASTATRVAAPWIIRHLTPRGWPTWTAAQVVVTWPQIVTHESCKESRSAEQLHAHVESVELENRTAHVVFDSALVVTFLDNDPAPSDVVEVRVQTKTIKAGETRRVNLEQATGRRTFACPGPSTPAIALRLEYTLDGRRWAREYGRRPYRIDRSLAGWRHRRKWLMGKAVRDPRPIQATAP